MLYFYALFWCTRLVSQTSISGQSPFTFPSPSYRRLLLSFSSPFFSSISQCVAGPGGAAAAAPPEGPHSGYLIQQDEEYDEQAISCWGRRVHNPYLLRLPFSQNRRLTVKYTTSNGETSTTSTDEVFLVPVPDQPLSANRYFVVRATGSHAGEICACSREQDRLTFCCCLLAKDVEPGPFREGDVYQQVEVVPGQFKGCFSTKPVADDGIPPQFLRRKGWKISASVPTRLLVDIGAASGVDRALREKKPEVGSSAAVVVGKWYTPFFFAREEESSPKDQMKRSVYFEVALEQFWEAIFTRENPSRDQSRRVEVRATVRTQSALLSGGEPVRKIIPQPDGSAAFRPAEPRSGAVTLSRCLMERMKWEQARGGWTPGEGGVAVVEKEEEYPGNGDWSSFKCSVLVERFSIKRLDGSLVIALDFRHTGKIIVEWE